MNELKNTPGPWEYRAGFICTKEEEPIVLSGIPRWHKKHTRINDTPFAGYQNGYFWPSKDEVEANAKVMAAAPEMKDELLRHLPILERIEADPELWDKLTKGTGIATLNGYRAAIAKATNYDPRTTRRSYP
jgi:hypothetical protein